MFSGSVGEASAGASAPQLCRITEALGYKKSKDIASLCPFTRLTDRVVAMVIKRGTTYSLSTVFLNCSSNLRPIVVVVSGVSPCDRSTWSLLTVSLAVLNRCGVSTVGAVP